MAFVILWFLFLLAYAIVCGCVAGSVARNRDRSYGGYFTLGFFFGLIGVLAAAFSGRQSSSVIHHHHYYGADGHEMSGSLRQTRPLARSGMSPVRPGVSSSRMCPNRGCRAYGRSTLNNECTSCETMTVPMRSTLGQLGGTSRGPALPGRPGVSAGRACRNGGCAENGVPTSCCGAGYENAPAAPPIRCSPPAPAAA